MSVVAAPLPTTGRLARAHAWAERRPGQAAFRVLFVAFGVYLFTSESVDYRYDDGYYWTLANQYWQSGSFDLYAFDSSLRGYFFPLLLAPLAWLGEACSIPTVTLVRVVGAALAAGFFGVVVPGLWQALQPAGANGAEATPVSWQRRLAFGALGFVFWRGYFNYPLTDFPSLLALAGGLWALLRGRSVGSGLLAGVAVAAAVNFRPVYLAALPLAGLLALWPRPATRRRGPAAEWGRRLAFVGGLALVGGPQLLLNQHHFDAATPLVLTHPPGGRSLYFQQLQMGLCNQKYETSEADDHPAPQMFFADPAGQALWRHSGPETLTTTAEYLALVRAAPAVVAGVWGRHLFNALDVQYPTPYVKQVYVPTWSLAWANYTVLGAGLLVLLAGLRRAVAGRRPPVPALLTLAALLLPCAAVLPVLVECRFLLPLHLLLCAALAFGARPLHTWKNASARARVLGLGLYLGLLAGAFTLSAQAQAQLEGGPRAIFEGLKPAPKPW